jgi:ABC-type nitrate/sulfonate/bicarbonate transport system substrate-binding protein
LVASVRAIKEKPAQIKRVIKASTKASGYIRQNREGTLPVMIKWLKIDRDIASVTYDSVWKAFTEDGSLPENGLRLAIEEAKRIGKVDRDVPFNEVADLSVLREAQKELGIK